MRLLISMGTKRGEFFEMCTSLHCLKLGESVNGLFKFIRGGRPKGSKRNLKFQSTTWPQSTFTIYILVVFLSEPVNYCDNH